MNPETLLLPDGRYLIGDPCYLLREGDPLQAEVSRLAANSSTDQNVFPIRGGLAVFLGDGKYFPDETDLDYVETFGGPEYHWPEVWVDSGCIVILPLDETHPGGGRTIEATFPEPVEVTTWKRDEFSTVLEIGPLTISTSPVEIPSREVGQ